MGVNAQKPLITAEIMRPEHPVFYGYGSKIFPIKFGQGSQLFKVGDRRPGERARAVRWRRRFGAERPHGRRRQHQGRAFAMDIPNAHNGNGRVLMFANNPIYRWQNHGEFNMVFNSILNWSYVPPAPPLDGAGQRRRARRASGAPSSMVS